MTYEISMTLRAKDGLHSIYEYIAFDLQSPQNAAKATLQAGRKHYFLG